MNIHDWEKQLSDGRILLRPYRLSDVNDLYHAASESIPQISLWMDWCHTNYSLEESRAWIESRADAWAKGTAYDFAITEAYSGFYIGGCGLNQIQTNNKVANLGYWVRTSRTKQGIATATTLLLARFGFDELKLNRIEIVVAASNKASQRVAEKVGAQREGLLRNRFMVGVKIHDAVMFSLIPQDFVR